MPTITYFQTEDITVSGRDNPPANPLNSGGAAKGLDGTTLTIAADASLQSFDLIDTADTNFDDDMDAQQTLADPTQLGFAAGTVVPVDNEWTLILSAGEDLFTAYGVAVGPGENIVGLTFVGDTPPRGVELSVIDTLEGAGLRGQPAVDYADLTPAEISGVICFTPGSMILTAQGPRLIQDLRRGDLIVTRDNGLQPLRWSGRSHLNAAQLTALPQLAPVRIKAGAFGPGLPARDMHVSPNHRFLIQGWRADILFGTPEVLVRAQALRNDSTIVTDHCAKDVTYIHLMFDQHQVITADGLETESFQPAADVTDGLDAQVRSELLTLFPQFRTNDLGALAKPVRMAVSDADAQTLMSW